MLTHPSDQQSILSSPSAAVVGTQAQLHQPSGKCLPQHLAPGHFNMVETSKAGVIMSKKEQQKKLTEQLKLVKQTIRVATEESQMLQHLPAFARFSKGGVEANVNCLHAEQLNSTQKSAVWALFEANMKGIYEADQQDWNPKAKQRELFHEDARYLLAQDQKQRLLAFTHFRFEVEENLLEDQEMQQYNLDKYQPVLYCYELQLDPEVHRKGLGKRLMQMLELLALKFEMHAVLLTVQKSNQGALSFYSALGYKQHPSCPERNGFADFDDVDPGHRIMWKDFRRNR